MATKKIKVEVLECRCERCGYIWQSKEMPNRCSQCKSPYWNRPRGQNGRRKK